MAHLDFNDFLCQFPKVDIHYHMLSGTRLETMQDLARKYNVPVTEEDARSYYRKYQTNKKQGGIAALNLLYRLYRSPDDYRRLLSEIAEDCHATGVRYLELFWNPSDCPVAYATLNPVLTASCDEIERQYGIVVRLIPAINREKSPEEAVRMVGDIIDNPHPYVLGLGIDYDERDAPIENFWKAYRLARDNGYRTTGHCSEFGLHWRNVETGIELIGLDRVDHGYEIVRNPRLAKQYAERGVPFTVVPSNTYFANLWQDRDEWRTNHPIRRMAELGMTIVPGTDDWHIHGTDAAEMYRVMFEEFGFDLASLKQCMCNGINASWAPVALKQQWREQWPAMFDQLAGQLVHDELPFPKTRHIHYKPASKIA